MSLFNCIYNYTYIMEVCNNNFIKITIQFNNIFNCKRHFISNTTVSEMKCLLIMFYCTAQTTCLETSLYTILYCIYFQHCYNNLAKRSFTLPIKRLLLSFNTSLHSCSLSTHILPSKPSIDFVASSSILFT